MTDAGNAVALALTVMWVVIMILVADWEED